MVPLSEEANFDEKDSFAENDDDDDNLLLLLFFVNSISFCLTSLK